MRIKLNNKPCKKNWCYRVHRSFILIPIKTDNEIIFLEFGYKLEMYHTIENYNCGYWKFKGLVSKEFYRKYRKYLEIHNKYPEFVQDIKEVNIDE